VLLPFEQVESSLNRTHNGTGLGLPLTAAMMMLHGGSIAIDSEIDRGTTVALNFPPSRLVDTLESETVAEAAAETAAVPPLRFGFG